MLCKQQQLVESVLHRATTRSRRRANVCAPWTRCANVCANVCGARGLRTASAGAHCALCNAVRSRVDGEAGARRGPIGRIAAVNALTHCSAPMHARSSTMVQSGSQAYAVLRACRGTEPQREQTGLVAYQAPLLHRRAPSSLVFRWDRQATLLDGLKESSRPTKAGRAQASGLVGSRSPAAVGMRAAPAARPLRQPTYPPPPPAHCSSRTSSISPFHVQPSTRPDQRARSPVVAHQARALAKSSVWSPPNVGDRRLIVRGPRQAAS
jgi:hypothetical protein